MSEYEVTRARTGFEVSLGNAGHESRDRSSPLSDRSTREGEVFELHRAALGSGS